MKIGYARVSTEDQNLDRQLEEFKKLGVERIYCDKKSGKDFERTEYQKMMNELSEDDVLYIKSIDRLGRNYDMIIEEWKKITNKANIVVIDMPLLDTTVGSKDLLGKFVRDLVLQILSYVAENERQNIKKRQAEGIAIAKAKGIYKKKEIDEEKFKILKIDFENRKITGQEFADSMGVSRQTIYKLLKEA